ncbi:MAG: DUF1801 domain-containing protein [Saprospiraceae bacterium]
MSKIQPFHFDNVDEFLDYLPEQEREIVEYLREIVFDCMPDCTEKLSYNVPYYFRHRRICFIWPSAVPWGKVKLDGVQFGFCNGHLLQDDLGYLEKGSRKQVYSKTFMNIADVDVDLLKVYIFEAAVVDEELRRR